MGDLLEDYSIGVRNAEWGTVADAEKSVRVVGQLQAVAAPVADQALERGFARQTRCPRSRMCCSSVNLPVQPPPIDGDDELAETNRRMTQGVRPVMCQREYERSHDGEQQHAGR